MNSTTTAARIVGLTESRAVQGKDLSTIQVADGSNPVQETLLRLLKVKSSKAPGECIVRGNAVG